MLGILLRPVQRISIYYIKLNMVAVEFKIRPDKTHQRIETCLVRQQLRSELLVKQCTAGTDMVQLGC